MSTTHQAEQARAALADVLAKLDGLGSYGYGCDNPEGDAAAIIERLADAGFEIVPARKVAA